MTQSESDLEKFIAELSERIASGETVFDEQIPSQWRNHGSVLRLLQIVRVSQGLNRNRNPVSDEPAPQRIGPWKVLKRLGSGGMGDVWLCERSDGAAEQKVAIKSVRSASVRLGQRLEQERRILSKLNHPNVARFIDAGVDSAGFPWMALDYVQGLPITEWCERQALSLEARVRLMIDVCEAVSHAHRHLIVHRDLKPSNLFVENTGMVKLLDFGISKLLDGEVRDSTLNALTPSYAAPEQLHGGEVSTATDIYAMGLLLFRLLAGALPRTRENQTLAQILLALDSEETTKISDCAQGHAKALPYAPQRLRGDLDAIAFKAIRLQPELRYASADAMAEDLRRFLAHQPVLARAPSPWYRFQRFARRNALALGLSALAAGSLVVGSVLALQQAKRAERATVEAQQQAKLARSESVRANRIKDFLAQQFRQMDAVQRERGQAISPRELIRLSMKSAQEEFRSDAILYDAVIVDLLVIDVHLGGASEALETIEKQLAFRQQHYGPQHPLYAELLRLKADALFELGRFVEAEPGLRQALSNLQNAGEDRSEEILAIENSLVRVHYAKSEFDQAVALARSVLQRSETLLGKKDFLVAMRRSNLAGMLMRNQQPLEAKKELEIVIAVLAETRGPDHASLQTPLLNLGDVYRDLEQEQEALSTYRRALAILDNGNAQEDNTYATFLNRIGDMQRRMRAFPEAEASLQRARAIQEKIRHSALGSTYLRLGQLAFDQDRAAEALQWYERSTDFYLSTQGEKSSTAIGPLGDQATALRALARYDEAYARRERQLALFRAVRPDPNLQSAEAMMGLSDIARERGDMKLAQDWLTKALAQFDTTLPSDSNLRSGLRIREAFLLITGKEITDVAWQEKAQTLLSQVDINAVPKLAAEMQAHYFLLRCALGNTQEQEQAQVDARKQILLSGANARWLNTQFQKHCNRSVK